MKILMITYYFPPYNAMGALRTGKTAKYLRELGHMVKVVSARDQPLAANLPVEIPESDIVRTSWLNLAKPAEMAVGGRSKVSGSGFESSGRKGAILSKAKTVYKSLFGFPDLQAGWYPKAVRAATKLAIEWKPDLIFASASPYTSLMAAKRVASKTGIPWVAEFRDLWTDNPYWEGPKWRLKLDRRLERSTLKTASAFVTVSEPLANVLREKFGKPTEVVLNGFDPGDIPSPVKAPSSQDALEIAYTGLIVVGKRDPSPLLRAIARMPKGSVRLCFYGKYLNVVNELAEHFGCADSVEVHPAVPYAEALQIQRNADVLLLLLWDNPNDIGSFTGKVFEYMGSRRPVLVVGPRESVASQLIAERNAGFVSMDENEIQIQLQCWIEQKKSGGIADLNPGASRGLTRKEQTQRLLDFLAGL